MSNPSPHPSSYRDPAGFIFTKEGNIYRQVNECFKGPFDHFIESGCYKHLVQSGLLISHQVIRENIIGGPDHYLTLQPEKLPFITYPYEWSFDMLKDAALLTLQLVREALHYGLILKDATPYNIQWLHGRLIFIDTLSFEKYTEQPWIAYRQFCESFLAPLLIMHHKKMALQQLQLAWPDGIPLAITRSLLPWKTKLSLHTYLHIHLHATVSSRQQGRATAARPFSKQKLLNLLSSLETLVAGLKFPEQDSTWSHYYEEAATRDQYLDEKKKIIQGLISSLPGIKTAIDLGANEGVFSNLLAQQEIQTIAADFDPYCINRLYKAVRNSKERNIQPMILDLANPSPGIGVNNQERSSFMERSGTDLALALALIHHLAIGKNIPFDKIAYLFHKAGQYVIVEFVPKSDEKVALMLSQKKDIYTNYTEDAFVQAFGQLFTLQKREPVGTSGRVLFLFQRK